MPTHRTSTADRILRALRSGPTYEGLLHCVVGGENFYPELYGLATAGKIEREPGHRYTWRLTDADA